MASVLKHNELNRGSETPQLIAFNVVDVQSRADEYLRKVREQAAEILTQAKTEAVQIHQQAKQKALQEAGQQRDKQVSEAAQKLSDERCKTAIAACEKAVESMSEATAEWLAQWRNQTVDLATRIAEKLVRRTLTDDNELLRVWMEEAIVAMKDGRELRVLVHPDDFAVAGRFLQKMTKIVPQANTIEILPDPEIQLGGCIVRSHDGQIDQQLETQLARLSAQLGC